MLSFYQGQLILLASSSILLLLLVQVFLHKDAGSSRSRSHEHGEAPSKLVAKLSRRYLCVYALVTGADWLQGPYIYSLYREEYGLPERLVALLFVVGYSSGGIAYPLVGSWADQYGRKRMCMVFCVLTAMSYALINVPILLLLFLGRFLGGSSSAIQSTAFESWLVSSAFTLNLSSKDLSNILGRAMFVNSLAATAAGVASDRLVEWRSTFTAPFLAGGVLLLLALVLLGTTWSENYGSRDSSTDGVLNLRRIREAWVLVRSDKRLLMICLIQTCFEGSLYLFVFAWVPYLQEVSLPDEQPPLGYIFSCFMVSMSLGSLLYTIIVSLSTLDSPTTVDGSPSTNQKAVSLHFKIVVGLCTFSGLALFSAVAGQSEHTRFWAFCAFEACAGVYYPAIGLIRGNLVPDGHRATLSALFRVPHDIFVLVALLTGVASARTTVLAACGALLCSLAVMTALVVRRADTSTSPTARGYETIATS